MHRWIYVFILLLACGFVKPVWAAGIAPATFDLEGSPGAVLKQELTIINTENVNKTYYLKTKKFTAQENESGSPKFSSDITDALSSSQWIFFENGSVIIPARSFAKVPFSIAVPEGTPAGSYFYAIVVGESPSEIVATNGATVQAETASLIFLTVSGETKLSGALLDFQIEPIDSNQIFGTYKYRIQNQGNVYFAPKTTVTLKDLFGRTLMAFDANQQAGRVLPNSTRTFEGIFGQENGKNFFETLKHQFAIFTAGPITANLEISLGENAPTLNSSETFWYIPWEMLSLIILALIFVLAVWLLVKRKRRR